MRSTLRIVFSVISVRRYAFYKTIKIIEEWQVPACSVGHFLLIAFWYLPNVRFLDNEWNRISSIFKWSNGNSFIHDFFIERTKSGWGNKTKIQRKACSPYRRSGLGQRLDRMGPWTKQRKELNQRSDNVSEEGLSAGWTVSVGSYPYKNK